MIDKFRKAVHLSNRQYCFLKEADNKGGITLERMLEISQTTAGSVVRRGLFRWDRRADRFILTTDGSAVMRQFQFTDVTRQNVNLPLSKYIDDREFSAFRKRASATTTVKLRKGKAA